MIPINGLIAKIMKSLQKQHMENKDSRTKLMTEVSYSRRQVIICGLIKSLDIEQYEVDQIICMDEGVRKAA